MGDIKELIDKLNHLEMIEHKYGMLKEAFEHDLPKINQKLHEVQEIIQSLNPSLGYGLIRGSRGISKSHEELVGHLIDTLKESGEDLTIQVIAQRGHFSLSTAQKVKNLLLRQEGIQTRLEGKILKLFYHETSTENGQVEISPGLKVPQKLTFMK